MSTETSFDRVMSLIKEGREKSYQTTFAEFATRVGVAPSTDFVTFGSDAHTMEYIRDRFIQDGFAAYLTTQDVDDKNQYDVTVNLQKHLPALPCLCGCKSLSGHVEVETPALTAEPEVNPTAEIHFDSGEKYLPSLLKKIGYCFDMEVTSCNRRCIPTNYRVTVRRYDPIIFPEIAKRLSLSVSNSDQKRVSEFLQKEGFIDIRYAEIGELWFTVPSAGV